MRSVIKLAGALAAVACLAVPALASADVPRYQSQDATFTVTQPAGAYNQWDNLWTHDYTVHVNPCDGTFSGTGLISGSDQNGPIGNPNEAITGKFGAGTVSLHASRTVDSVEYSLADAPTDGSTITTASLNVNTPQPVEMKVTAPVFTNTSSYKNHGDYVKAQGGGDDAAHSCIGMPLNSNK
jgi:hypothetical protein